MCNSTIYENVINNFEESKRKEIEAILNELEQGDNQNIRCIILSLRKERNLPQDCMEKILNSLYLNKHNNFIINYKNICKDYHLNGGVIINSGVIFFGHAVYKEDFVNRVIAASQLEISFSYDREQVSEIPDDFREAVNSCINDDRDFVVEATLEPYKKFIAHKYNMWATWDLAGNNDPFNFLKTRNLGIIPPQRGSLCEVGFSLGLCCKKLNEHQFDNMLLLTYKTTKIEAHIPTIADAMGYQYFSPCAEGESYGLTDTTHSDLKNYYIDRCLKLSGDSYNEKPRPEAVHKPITIDYLHKIEELPIPDILRVSTLQ
jgi:hypothetical protein